MEIDWKILREALKEPLRLLVLALISWAITYGIPQIDVKYAPFILLLLRFADKLVYEWEKETGREVKYSGITGF